MSDTIDPSATGMIWAAGEVIWRQGDAAAPLRVSKGIVAYRRGEVSIGLIGPGQVAMPVPGVSGTNVTATDLVAVTETVASEIPASELSLADQQASVNAIIVGADRLGNMALAQRLASLLLEMTAMLGHPVVHCRQDVLAMVAAARRETVSTVLSVWRDEDWIDTRYRRVIIRDREAMTKVLSQTRGGGHA